MPTLVISKDVLHDLGNLPKNVAGKLEGVLMNFSEQAFAGQHLEKPHALKDPRARTIRLDNFWRGVVMAPESGDRYFLMRIMAHDDAYKWVERNAFGINAATGAIEVVDIVRIEQQAAASQPSDLATGTAVMFAEHSDKTLRDLGISADVLPVVRMIATEDQLLSLAALLPLGQGDVLLQLADGRTPEEVWANLAVDTSGKAIDTNDFEAALERPSSAAAFVEVRGPDELIAVLKWPLDLWRVFLHPTQRNIAYRPVHKGPVRVSGGAGTGKTVVAMHRAKALADLLPADQPILFTTYTRNLSRVIARNLEVLGGKALRDRVTVNNVDRIASQVVRDAEGASPRVMSAYEQGTAWRQAVDASGSGYEVEFLQREWEHVILAQAITTRDDYLRAARPGRGGRLDRRQRIEVWSIVEAFGAVQRQLAARTFLQLSLEAAGYLAQRSVRPYAAVIVDEAQDLHPAQWRLLRALVAEGENDMFLVGDAYQRIYGNRTTLSKVGINIVGRSFKLRLNYRTTRQILGWAMALLEGVEADDLDGLVDSLNGYRSLLSGGAPTFTKAPSAAAEASELAAWAKQLIDAGFEPSSIAIAGRIKATCETVTAALKAAGLPVNVLDGQDDGSNIGIAVGTMHRMKGLEFRAVAIANCARGSVPLPAAIVPENVDAREHARSIDTERSLLFVACTRAREVLRVSWSGSPSDFVAATGITE